jgi:hypothetical protein
LLLKKVVLNKQDKSGRLSNKYEMSLPSSPQTPQPYQQWADNALEVVLHGDLLVPGLHAMKHQLAEKIPKSLLDKLPVYSQKPIQVVSPARMMPSRPPILTDAKCKPLVAHIIEKFPDVGDISQVKHHKYSFMKLVFINMKGNKFT